MTTQPPLATSSGFGRLHTSSLEDPVTPHFTASDSDEKTNMSERLPHKSPSQRSSMATRSDLANRRRSVLREYKPPLGPRPPDFSSKRTTSASKSNADQEAAAQLPHTTSETFSTPSSKRNTSNFEHRKPFGEDSIYQSHTRKPSIPSNTSSKASKPSSIHEAQLDDFPKPGGQRRQSMFNRTGPRTLPVEPIPTKESGLEIFNNAVEGNGTGLSRLSDQQNDAALRAAQYSTNSSSTGRASAYHFDGGRRQSQFPPSSLSNPSHKQPRKSIGPGYSVPGTRERTEFDPAFRTLTTDFPSPDPASNRRTSQAAPKSRSLATVAPSSEGGGGGPTSKPDSVKGLSLHTTPPQLQTTHAFLDLPPPSASLTPQNESRSPVKAGTYPAPVPSLSTRRQSTAVGHVGSLGARTVSPTDVRRSRRMSVSNRPPPLPTRSPTPDIAIGDQSPPTPPLNMRQKSMTPQSPRDTPDVPQRRNSGRSVSSRSSYNSARPNSSASQRRSSFTNFSARSPTIKSRNLASSHGAEGEAVPPVPAIPKAYESPSEVMDKPFFSDIATTVNGKNSGALDAPNVVERFMTPEEGHGDASTSLHNARQSRRLTLGARPDAGRDIPSLITNKHWVQGPRLPPINLLPLSTPTANKIASLTQKSSEDNQGKVTPPPSKGHPKTPTTPMTASKALFSSHDFQQSFDLNHFPALRSSTSYAPQKSETSTLNESESESPVVLTPASPAPPATRHGPSPYGSFSLPRPTGDAQQYAAKRHRESVKEVGQSGGRTSRGLVRRPSNMSKSTKKSEESKDNTHAFTDTEASQTGSSLRRKLSIGWRRSSSKASHISHHTEGDNTGQSMNQMPPPRLPASTSKTNVSRKSPKPSSAYSSQTDLGLPAGLSFTGSRSANSSNPELPRVSNRQSSMKIDTNQPTSKSGASLFSPMQRMLGSRSSSHNIKAQRSNAGLDKDDLAAEEEMKKLGSKKKEFESSARELDELKKRAAAKERASPSQATRFASLNIFEKGEIVDYKGEGVYFCGTKDAKKFPGDLGVNNSNFGFDDERGDYNIVFGDHLAYRYEVIDVLGKGSFGQVVRCVDHKTGGLVAVKIIRNKKRFHQQALVEVNILQKLRDWDPESAHSMINFTQCFYFRGHLCIATELLGINLYEFIKAHDFVGFSLKLIRRFSKQMLSSLCLLQKHNVIHCDLKPENILLAHPLHSEIKVIDFGSSCFDSERVYTYIQSRFYRSPEVILGMNYGMPIDMWSLGCILAELFTGYPIFPGENEQEQLACIMEVFGPPEKHLIEKSSRKKVFFDSLGKPRITVSSKGKRRRPSSKTLTQALKCDDEAFVDFIARCLRWDPDRRMRPDEAVNHEFVTGAKKSTRARSQYGANTASPAKRSNTIQTPAKTRNIPEPPATSYKNGVPVSSRNSSTSPVKGAGAGPRRKSTMYDQQAVGTRVASNGVGSGLPRATASQRNVSGKPDLASAAAAISLAGGTKNKAIINGG